METRVALRLDHAAQSLGRGQLGESVKLVDALIADSPHSISEHKELTQWISKARKRLAREEHIKTLQIYTDKLLKVQK